MRTTDIVTAITHHHTELQDALTTRVDAVVAAVLDDPVAGSR